MRFTNLVVLMSLHVATSLAQQPPLGGQSQSVAQRITQLTQDVATLKTQGSRGAAVPAPGAPIVVRSASGRNLASVGLDESGGTIQIFNYSAGYALAELGVSRITNVGGLWIYGPGPVGTNELARVMTTEDGTSGSVSVTGPKAQFSVNGTAHDYAEVFDVADRGGIRPGSVVAEAASGDGLLLASGAYSSSVVGVIAGAGDFHSGMVIGSRDDGSTDLPIATSGQVFVRVSAEAGPIAVGDLLVNSSTPGVAMRGSDPQRLNGTVIGKALQPYSGLEEGLIRMLVLNR
jgi:hypothetical protein